MVSAETKFKSNGNRNETEGDYIGRQQMPGARRGRMGTEILHEAADGHMQFHIMEVF